MCSLERLAHHLYLPHPHKRPKGLEALAANYTISQVAEGMMASFGVLFIFELGGGGFKGLGLMIGFFSLQRLVTGLTVPMAAGMISSLGYRWTMFWGLSALALKAFLLMEVTTGSLWLLGPALVLGGFSIAGYYLGYHGIFLNDNDDHKIGEEIGKITMLGRLALIGSPILAGFLVDWFSFSVMFGAATFLLLVSILPLFLMPKHEHNKNEFSFKKSIKMIKKEDGFFKPVFWWHAENGIQVFFWPVFLFLILKSHISFGVIGSLVMVINSIAVYTAGKTYDQRPLRRGFRLTAGLVIFSYFLRFFSFDLISAVSADSFNRLASPWWWMKIRRKALIAGEKMEAMVFAAGWEWAVTLGYLVSLLAGGLILWLSRGAWEWLAVLAGLAVYKASRSMEKYG